MAVALQLQLALAKVQILEAKRMLHNVSVFGAS
jgi:hypothetical protein